MVLDVDLALVYRFSEAFFLRMGPEVGVTLGLERSTPLDGIRHPITSLVARPGETRMPHASS